MSVQGSWPVESEMPLMGVSGVYTAIKTDSDSKPIPCRYVSVQTTGTFTITNADGTTTASVILNTGILYPISTRVMPTGSGTIWVWY